MTTDEDLARVTVGEVRPLDGPVALAEYDPRWPARYAALEQAICVALGDAVVVVEHVGSTSVPGLVAKPVIDWRHVQNYADAKTAVVAEIVARGPEA